MVLIDGFIVEKRKDPLHRSMGLARKDGELNYRRKFKRRPRKTLGYKFVKIQLTLRL